MNLSDFDKLNVNVLPWSLEDMVKVSAICDFCLLPAALNDSRKMGASSNRLLTAFALGLPVLSDLIPSYRRFKENFIDIREKGSLQLMRNFEEFHPNVVAMQEIIESNYTSEVISDQWEELINFECEVAERMVNPEGQRKCKVEA